MPPRTTSTAPSACPGLGLKRGLAADLVVAPYATAMALMVDPREAVLNLQRLADDGLAGTYGFYEAIDYTASRLPRGDHPAPSCGPTWPTTRA
jgi:cyclic beta-1,2-glucan synthetase